MPKKWPIIVVIVAAVAALILFGSIGSYVSSVTVPTAP